MHLSPETIHDIKLTVAIVSGWLMVDGLVVYLGFRATKIRDAKRLRQASDQVSNISFHDTLNKSGAE